MKRFLQLLRKVGIFLLAAIVLFAITVTLFLYFAPQIGGTPEGDRLERMLASPNYDGEIFQNTVETNMDIGLSDYPSMMYKFFKGVDRGEPDKEIMTTPFDAGVYSLVPDSQTAITWFGHSTALVKLEGKTLLIDPVFSPRTSMVSFMGPKNFKYDKYMQVEDLPEVDAVIISHDHYDHLDYETIVKLKEKVDHFFVPLGIGAHFERWEISADAITEMDWWEEAEFEGLTMALTPSRHFSGRGLADRSTTLWGSWAILGQNQKIYFSGDGGYTPEFQKIGEKYGPFDLAFIECGQYNEMWAAIHMMPEESVQASIDLQAKVMIPIHWGKFPLALHTWEDPVERMTARADELGVDYLLPTVGETMILTEDEPKDRWWEAFL